MAERKSGYTRIAKASVVSNSTLNFGITPDRAGLLEND